MPTWFNGKLIDGLASSFDLSDRGLLLGDGVFDTALVLQGRVVYREAHLARLNDACRTIGIRVERAALATALDVAAEKLAFGATRLTVTRGPGPRGLVSREDARATLIASSVALASNIAFKPVSLWTSVIRRNERSPSSRLKTLGYLDAVMATKEARDNGFDEPLFLNTRDRVACAGTGNLFLIAGREVVTPPLEEGVLAGVLRGVVLRLASQFELSVSERPVEQTELIAADAVFVSNSLKLIAPVKALDRHRFSLRFVPVLTRLVEAIRTDIERDCGCNADHLFTHLPRPKR